MATLARQAVPAEAVDAGRVLSFVNTLSARPTDRPVERLVSYEALIDWAREQRLVSGPAAERLADEARKHPQQAGAVLSRAKAFREALNGLASAIESGRTPSADILRIIGTCLSHAYLNARLVPHEGTLQWAASADDDLERVVWEIARSAGRLITSPRLSRVRSCAADDCGWWFLDDTKNGSRRWCDMKLCGNRAKVRRFRHREPG